MKRTSSPRQASWHKLSDAAQCEIARRLREAAHHRVAKALGTTSTTLIKLLDGGLAHEHTISRIEATIAEQRKSA